ncbi:hypothetical protein [Litoreibacter arenae]|nr:hypothetical protein [Litoreibacter arenae]
MSRQVLIFLSLLIPTQVYAFDFGFVRGPDWMDQYVGVLFVVTMVFFALTMLFKPRGIPMNEMYQHFGDFSPVGRLVYAIFGLAFVGLMGMVFLGMGLQRAAEASL